MQQQDVSYAAGVAYLLVTKEFELKILLVLQRPGKIHKQSGGTSYRDQRLWKMPIGKKEAPDNDNLKATAVREFQEETGRVLNREDLRDDLSLRFRIPSNRPGFKEHEDVFFLVLKGREPELSGTSLDAEVEIAKFFPITALPTGDPRISFGHLIKLVKLINNARGFLSASGLNVQEIVWYLKDALNAGQSRFKKPSV